MATLCPIDAYECMRKNEGIKRGEFVTSNNSKSINKRTKKIKQMKKPETNTNSRKKKTSKKHKVTK